MRGATVKRHGNSICPGASLRKVKLSQFYSYRTKNNQNQIESDSKRHQKLAQGEEESCCVEELRLVEEKSACLIPDQVFKGFASR